MTQIKIIFGLLALFSYSQQAVAATVASQEKLKGVDLGYCPTFKKVTEKGLNSNLSFTIAAFAPEFKSIAIDTKNRSIVCTYQSDNGDTYNAYASLDGYTTCGFGAHLESTCSSDKNNVKDCAIYCSQ